MGDQIMFPSNRNRESRLAAFIRRWPIVRRLLATSVLSLLSLLFIIIVIAVSASTVFSSFNKLINDTTQETRIFSDLNMAIQKLMSETREYALSQESGTLDEIEEAYVEINNYLVSIFDTGSGIEKEAENAEEIKKLEELQAAVLDLEAGVGQIITLVQKGVDIEELQDVIEELEVIEQNLETLLEDIDSDLQEETSNITTQITEQIQRTIVVVLVGVVFFFVVNLGISHFAADSIINPINDLVQTSNQIADGNIGIMANDEGEDEISILANAYNRMNARQRDLLAAQERSAKALENTLNQITASAQVAQAVASILEPDELITQVVTLIQEAFGLYYVGVFVVDDRNEWAILRAGTGIAGQAMLGRQHRIKIGEGMIGWSIANAQARVALDIAEDDIRLATSELPETRSELAVPLRSRGDVLGALTVQDRKPNAFDDQAIAILQQMADQVATALENARLFASSQAALEASRRAFTDISQEAWNQYFGARSDMDFLATPQSEIKINADEWPSDMAKTFQVGDIIRHGEKSVHIPIVLRDQTLGVVRLNKRDGAGPWTSEEIELMDALVDQLETALETARLYSDTQRQAAHVSLTQNVTDKLHRSLDMDSLMQTLLEEVSTALGASGGFVQLSTPTQASDSAGNTYLSEK